MKLSELNESHPVQTAEFAVAQGTDHEPAYNSWVKHVLKKRDRVIASFRRQRTRYLTRSHELGIELSKTVDQALALDAKNGNTLWADATSNEIKNFKVAFEVLPDGKSVPIGHQFVQCHMVFDINMEDFRCKARLVAGGHMTKPPATIIHANVVSRETVKIALICTQ